jgi:predicted O-methyltransferase YrrM
MEETSYITPPAQLDAIVARTAELGFGMASERGIGNVLQVLAASKPGGHLLELGTGTGVATSWILSGMDQNASLISVDNDEDIQAVAKQFLDDDPRLKLVTLDAAQFLWRQPKKSFDLVFADAMIGKYIAGDDALALVAPGGFYVIDDLLPRPTWPEDHAEKVPELLCRLAANPKFHMLPMVWSTGIAVMVRKPPILRTL